MDDQLTPVQLDIADLSLKILEGTPDAVLFADRDGIIRFWNRGAERIFGFPMDEALGSTLDLIIPERLRERHWAGYRYVLDTQVSRYQTSLLAVPALHKDGHQLSCEFSIVMIRNEKKQVSGFAAIMRDVTDRWEKEKILKKQLADLQKESE